MRKVFMLVLMLAIVVGTQYKIAQNQRLVTVKPVQVAGNPAEHYAAVGTAQGTVFVAHGFASSKEMMQYWGYALARQGFDTYIFDQPGHGAQSVRLPAWQSLQGNPLGSNLQAMVAELIQSGQAKPGKIALVGHSMGGAAVLAAGLEDPAIAATVALSAAYFEPLPTDRPVKLLSLVAEREPVAIQAAAQALVPSDDRQMIAIPGRNHLTILYDEEAMAQATAWIHKAFGTSAPAAASPVAPWGWIALALSAGLGAVLAVASLLSPREVRTSVRLPALGFLTGFVALAVASLSAVLGTVYLRAPWVGLAVLDYLLPYFLVAAAVLLVLRWLWPRDFAFPLIQGADTMGSAVGRGAGITLGYVGAVVPVIHMNLANHFPTPGRILPLLLSMLVLWLYFVQEEGLKRAVASHAGWFASLLLGIVGKLLLIGTWFGATALPNPPTFLTLTIPVVLVMLLVLELLGAVLSRMRFSSTTTATLNAVVLAWAMAVTFPLI